MKFNNFKPQLLSNEEYNLEDLDYTNMCISTKRDGVRVEVTKEGLFGRSLKKLPNMGLQSKFKAICEQLSDTEIIECEVWSPHRPCREIAGICNSDNKFVPSDLILYAFDYVDLNKLEMQASERTGALFETMKAMVNEPIKFVDQIEIGSAEEVIKFYDEVIANSGEGAVLRDMSKPYKKGRVTIKQHIGYKLKKHREDDLEIIGVTERMLNLNESKTNELGASYKRNTVNAKQGTGIAATFLVKLPNGETCGVSLTGDEDYRREIWDNKESYIGRIAIVKSMDFGIKSKLRHPRLVRVKENVEW